VRLAGHCPHISGADLNEYLGAGIDSDDTKSSAAALEEAARRLVAVGERVRPVRDGADPVDLPLPVRGVISTGCGVDVTAAARGVREAVRQWSRRHANSFMSLMTPAIADLTAGGVPQISVGGQHSGSAARFNGNA